MRPDPMVTCPHDVPSGTRCIDCGDPFNYELGVAIRQFGRALATTMPAAWRKAVGMDRDGCQEGHR